MNNEQMLAALGMQQANAGDGLRPRLNSSVMRRHHRQGLGRQGEFEEGGHFKT